jgi:serine/threonine protein kinase
MWTDKLTYMKLNLLNYDFFLTNENCCLQNFILFCDLKVCCFQHRDMCADFMHIGLLMVVHIFYKSFFSSARILVWAWNLFYCSVDGPLLFSFVCKQDDEYREATVCHYMRQLLSALGYLHSQGIAYLDVKVMDSFCKAFITWHICFTWVEEKQFT